MAKKEKSYTELAARSRRMAKAGRVLSVMFALLALLGLVVAIAMAVSQEWGRASLMAVNTATISLCAWSIWGSSKSFDRSAASWERLAARPF